MLAILRLQVEIGNSIVVLGRLCLDDRRMNHLRETGYAAG